MDILLLPERITQSIQLGESQFREFKSALEGPPASKASRDPKLVSRDIAETLVAFANADGGELLIGVEDDGTITGLLANDTVIERLLAAPQTNVHNDTPLTNPVARCLQLENHVVLYFSIEKSTRTIHQTSDGKCLQRKDRENRPVSATVLEFERREQMSREYDRQFLDGTSVADLNFDILTHVSDRVTRGMSPEKCLQYLGLAEYGLGGIHLRRAALLLFASDVTKWHPRCQVRVLRVRGTELRSGKEYNVSSDEICTGSLLQLVTAAWEKLRPHLVQTKLSPAAVFAETMMYPEDACREALINAITHRDYSNEGQCITIIIFDDRIEVQSPGGLLSNIHVADLIRLQGVHESRNALAARVLREVGYVREMGEGMRRMFQLMRDADLVAPELISEPGRFTITLRYKSVFSERDQRWLDAFGTLKLTHEEMLIALLGKDGHALSPQQIYDALKLVDWDIYREIIDQIMAKGIVFKQQGKKTGRRTARLVVRQPEECEQGLKQVFSILRACRPVIVVDDVFLRHVLAHLPTTCIYRIDSIHFAKLLNILGLRDANRRPTSLLQQLWSEAKPEGLLPEVPSVVPHSNYAQQTAASRAKPLMDKQEPLSEIYVGNVPACAKDDDLQQLFATCGVVTYCRIPYDQFSGQGKGYAFVRMSTLDETLRAISVLHDEEFLGVRISVKLAYPRRKRRSTY